jgi:hypothetical protein
MRHLMNILARIAFALSLLLGLGIALNETAQAQQPYRVSERQLSNTLRRLDQNSTRFRNSLDTSLDRSRSDGTRAEDDINAFVRDFDSSVEYLRQRFNDRQSVAADVESVLQKAAVIDNFIARSPAAARSRSDWALVRADLDTLASAYGVSWRWDGRSTGVFGNRGRNDNVGRDRNWDRYGNYGGSFDLRQTALNAGYNEGLKVGQNDRGRNRTSDYRNSTAYQRATTDYSSRLGDRELYRRYYREGFQTGYNDGYGTQTYGYPQGGVNRDRDWTNNGGAIENRDRRGRNWDRYETYGGSSQLRQTALNAGYNEGIKVGRQDRNRNTGSNFRNSSVYEQATKDYSSRLGDRELYRRYFREGFETGYNDGYNGN